MSAVGTRVVQHGAVTVDTQAPTVTVRRPVRLLPPSLLAASTLVMLNAVLAVFDLPYTSSAQPIASLCGVLAVWLVPVLVSGYAWSRLAITAVLGAQVATSVLDVLASPDLRHAGIALRAVLAAAPIVILLFRERANLFFTHQLAERTIARLPRG